MLGTARTNPDKLRAGLDDIKQTLEDNGIDVLIPIGRRGHADRRALALRKEGVPVVGVSQDHRHDIDCNRADPFGHDTALQLSPTDAIDRCTAPPSRTSA